MRGRLTGQSTFPVYMKHLYLIFTARQCSKRGGDVKLSLDEPNDRIYVGGKASIVLSGKLHLPVME